MSRNKLVAIALILSAVCFTACKKQACLDVVCPANSECKDGDCNLTCGPNRQLVNGHCLCVAGWGGIGCVVHSAALAGKYHFTGYEISYNVTATPRRDTTFINDTADVIFSADTVFAREKQFVYGTPAVYSFIRLYGFKVQ